MTFKTSILNMVMLFKISFFLLWMSSSLI